MVEDIGVEKSEYPDVERVEKSCSFAIVFDGLFAEVGVTIEFDGETFRRAIKINDVIADAVLPTKFVAELIVLQGTPELLFGWSSFVPEGFAAGFQA